MIKTVGELKAALSAYPDNMPIAAYSREGECDFPISKLTVSKIDEYGIEDFYCQADSYFSKINTYAEVKLPIKTKILVLSGGSR